jgi:RNA polymerase sigma factor (sigma-70 family)
VPDGEVGVVCSADSAVVSWTPADGLRRERRVVLAPATGPVDDLILQAVYEVLFVEDARAIPPKAALASPAAPQEPLRRDPVARRCSSLVEPLWQLAVRREGESTEPAPIPSVVLLNGEVTDAKRPRGQLRGDERAIEAERAERLRRALDQLSARRRAVVVLHDLEGLAVDEIAAVVGAKPVAVRSRLQDGRRALAEILKCDPYFGDAACRQEQAR